jgi:predicted RNase H-like HicB family nuclease
VFKNKKGESLMAYRVSITIEKDEHGYHAYSPAFEESQTQGDSLDEVMEKIKEPIEIYLETCKLAGLYIQI